MSQTTLGNTWGIPEYLSLAPDNARLCRGSTNIPLPNVGNTINDKMNENNKMDEKIKLIEGITQGGYS